MACGAVCPRGKTAGCMMVAFAARCIVSVELVIEADRAVHVG